MICFCHRHHLGILPSRLYRMAAQTSRQISNPSGSHFMIVGLGNTDGYRGTRHSVGMQAVDMLADWLDVQWCRQRTLHSMVATRSLPDQNLHLILVKPKTLMNNNGRSIHKAAQHYRIDPSNIYLMHDELDKPIGATKMKNGGSARGHNGVRSAIASLKSDVMPRLLIGIDRPLDKSQITDYVLERFTREEQATVDVAITDGLSKLLRHLQENACIESDLVAVFRKPTLSNPSLGAQHSPNS